MSITACKLSSLRRNIGNISEKIFISGGQILWHSLFTSLFLSFSSFSFLVFVAILYLQKTVAKKTNENIKSFRDKCWQGANTLHKYLPILYIWFCVVINWCLLILKLLIEIFDSTHFQACVQLKSKSSEYFHVYQTVHFRFTQLHCEYFNMSQWSKPLEFPLTNSFAFWSTKTPKKVKRASTILNSRLRLLMKYTNRLHTHAI